MPALTSVKIRTRLVGVTELNMHNIRLANPDDEWTRKIAALTGKRKMSEEDRREKARLEFLGGLYIHESHVIVPQPNLKRAFKEGAKSIRMGRNIDRALHPADALAYMEGLPLEFPDSGMAPDELWETRRYSDTTIVASPGRVPRTRPRFTEWALTADWTLYISLVSVADFRTIAEYTALVEGLGDNRINGSGRFQVTVEEM
jgi:hypothetical protein